MVINDDVFRMNELLFQGSDSQIFIAHSLKDDEAPAVVIKCLACRKDSEVWRRTMREIESGIMLRKCPYVVRSQGYSVLKGRGAGEDYYRIFLLFDRLQCLDDLKKRISPNVLELCSGTGIIAVTIAKQLPTCTVTAIEKEKAAFEYLEKNIAYHRADNVKALSGDIFLCYDDFEDMSFDALVSNPPYIETDVVPTLQREVQFEPETALDGGSDGLDFYRCIAEKWSRKLRHGGSITLEIGESQAQAVTEILLENGFRNIMTVKDIQGLDRVIYGTRI